MVEVKIMRIENEEDEHFVGKVRREKMVGPYCFSMGPLNFSPHFGEKIGEKRGVDYNYHFAPTSSLTV